MVIASRPGDTTPGAEPVEPRPASTVVLLRDGADGMETLLLRRNKALMFAGGFWVFPGGSLDEEDLAEAGGDLAAASRIAAWREAQEESGLTPRLEDMIQISHWTTPVVEPKRFYTWIYAAPVDSDDEVVIDGGEIHDHLWIGIREVVQRHRQGDFGILPPTYVTLCDLARFDTVAQFLASERGRTPHEVLPVIAFEGDQVVAMYRGDAGYDAGDPALPGARHRLTLKDKVWHFCYRDVDPAIPPLMPPE